MIAAPFTIPVAFIAATMCLQSAAAQDPESRSKSASSAFIEEVTVVARKREENLQEAPVSVTAFSAKSLQDNNIHSIEGIGQYTPNLTFQAGAAGSGDGNNAMVYIRGVGQFDILPTADPGVGMYLDGVYLGRSVGGIFNIVDLERVEVLRGPQGTLFGRNTIGGAINVISRKPEFDSHSGFVDLTAGNDSWYGATGVVNIPLADRAAARLSANFDMRDGFSESEYAPGIDFGNSDNYTVRGQFLYEPTASTSLLVAADYYSADENPVPVSSAGTNGFPNVFFGYNGFVQGTLGFPAQPQLGPVVMADAFVPFGEGIDRTTSTGPAQNDTETGGISVTVDFDDVMGVSVKSITSYRTVETALAYDGDGTYGNVVDQSSDFEQSQVSQEIQISGETDNMYWIGGLYFFHEDSDRSAVVDIFPGLVAGLGIPTLSPGYQETQELSVDNMALYGQTSYNLTDDLALTLGLRYTYEEKEFDYATLNYQGSLLLGTPQYIVAPANAKESWDNLSPRIGVDYQTTGGNLLYAVYSRGFKSGAFNGRANSLSGVTNAVDPEVVDAFEVGYKSDWADGRLRVNGAVFYNDYAEIHTQSNVAIPGGGGAFEVFLVNASKAKIYGLEVEVLASLTDNLFFAGSGGYQNSEISEIDPATSATTGIQEGFVLSKTPEWNYSASLTYIQPVESGDISFKVDYSWQDEVYHRAANTPDTLEDAYGLVGARISYANANQGYEVSLFGTNLTDEPTYRQLFEAGGTTLLGYPNRGVSYGINLRKDF
ncbi:MAG: TonB-dependent receptor [Pseudomonadales bacterium]